MSVGGEFEYWPGGLDQPSVIQRPPYSNTAVLADNEYMLHRVGPIGEPERHVPLDGVPFEATLELTDDRRWEVRDGDRSLLDYGYDEVRLSVLWKAYCFKDAAEAAAYDDKRHDLTPQLVTSIFCDDLSARGIRFSPPGADLDELGWKQTLLQHYPAPMLPPSPGEF